ncbi:LCP family protein [Marinactinospora rubrisoli]|uniref:LCP family protein n=1 Tax=Marinactinospora rubrisoli TaxID=2715399 RepID=A0ABW2KEH2_9ACTN
MNEDGDGSRTHGDTAEPPGTSGFRRVRSGPLPPADAPRDAHRPRPKRRRAADDGRRPQGRRGSRNRAAAPPFPLPSRRVRRKRVMLLLTGAMSIVVLLASGGAWAVTGWASGLINRFDVFGGLTDRPDAGARGALNFLVIGSDSRGELDSGRQSDLGVGHVEGQRSDTMMLVHLNRDRDAITVVGIPRDSWVDIPGHGGNKINAAYAFGGPQLAVQTVESATGVRIDHYVEIDFGGFVDVVDAVGGIEVCLPEAIHDDKAHLSMEAGTHHVDGTEALAFARTRQTSNGDLDRIDRQQQVMSALLDQVLSTDTLSDPDRFTRFLDTALRSLTVDEGLDTGTINQLGNQLRDISLTDVAFTQVPVANMEYWTPHGDVAVTWNESAAREVFARIAADRPLDEPAERSEGPADAEEDPVPAGEISVQVFNGVGTSGLGGRVAGELAGAGFQVPGQAQNWFSHDVAETLVRYGPGQERAAETVAAAIPGARVEADPALTGPMQVVVGANYQGVTPPTPATEPAPEATPEGGTGRDTVRTSTAADNVCE